MTRALAERVPAEAVVVGLDFSRGMLSRGVAGIRGSSIVVNFPGSVAAVRLCMKVIGPIMDHALRMLRGEGHG